MMRGRWLGVVVWLLAVCANAQVFRVSGFLIARGINVESQPSWLAGGFGRLDAGARSAGSSTNTHQEEAQLAVDWTPSQWFTLHAHGVARDEPQAAGGRRGGLVEAYIDLHHDFGANGLRLRAGEFFLPTSRENTDPLWNSPYTISFSALNTWIGEEFRPVGAELQWVRLTPVAVITAAGGAFRDNDTMGTLLGWRGWSIGNRLSVYGETLPLPPLRSLHDPHGFVDQRPDGTQPFGPDLDGRTGFTARVRASIPDRALLQFARIDNRADRDEYRGEYAWQTRLNLLSAELDGQHGTTLAAEYGWGSTGMGFAPRAFVDLTYYAAYALVSQKFGRNRFSVRLDAFNTRDRDHSIAETNDESGRAWTLAWFFEPHPSVRLGTEFANISARRLAAAESGFDPNTDGRTLTVEVRVRF
ncbi:MAG TPA: hypothetical protein VKH35_03635 [Thermoanaerobaculia bacterium]|nr:hypothetical protein [Thermoanaerobaculia bacterium]